jgi:hypothetical protein
MTLNPVGELSQGQLPGRLEASGVVQAISVSLDDRQSAIVHVEVDEASSLPKGDSSWGGPLDDFQLDLSAERCPAQPQFAAEAALPFCAVCLPVSQSFGGSARTPDQLPRSVNLLPDFEPVPHRLVSPCLKHAQGGKAQ